MYSASLIKGRSEGEKKQKDGWAHTPIQDAGHPKLLRTGKQTS